MIDYIMYSGRSFKYGLLPYFYTSQALRENGEYTCRPGWDTAFEDLARAISFVFRHAKELQVDTDCDR